ncbi:MAG: amidohydrolase family protein [Deltaproteobacteria bacterium]
MPVTAPILADGGVLVGGGRILEVGPFSLLKREAGRIVELDGALLPRLINCHSHLELAAYGEAMRAFMLERPAAGFPDWISKLLQLRSDAGIEPANRRLASEGLLEQMAGEGVALVLDTGNLVESGDLGAKASAGHRFLLEILGLSAKAAEKKIKELEQLEASLSVTAHAPYSTHPSLLKKIKARCGKYGQLFSIHTAESPEESDFLQNGSGGFVDFLRERGVLDDDFRAPGCSTVEYFEQLGLLDQKTLCVHCVQVSDGDIEKLAEHGAAVCLCPGSNRTLGVGTAPVPRMAAAGVRLCLGTDSRASNPRCSMWREMRFLGEEHPSLAPGLILAMATIGGAAVLGIEDLLGSLEAGKYSEMIVVKGNFADQRQLSEALVSVGEGIEVEIAGIDYA